MTDARPATRSSTGPIPWYRQLGVQLAALLAVVLIVFQYTHDDIADRVIQLVGLPDPNLDVWVPDSTWIEDELLAGAEQLAPGRWAPSEEVLAFQAESHAVDGLAFVWLDTSQQVVVTSSDALPWAAGDRWTADLPLVGEVHTPDGRVLRATTTSAELDGEPAGTLVSLLVDPEVHALLHGLRPEELDDSVECEYTSASEAVTVDEATFERRAELLGWAYDVFSLGVTIVIALLLAVAVSWLVTRRLRRLAAAAALPLSETDGLPGPFPEDGIDEIGALARAMNDLRARTASLLHGLAARDTSRRDWVAQVSHDLRTPLTALMACLDRAGQVLDDEQLGERRDELREILRVARLDAERVCVLAEDLLDIARLEADAPLDLEPVPPGELVRQAVAELSPMAAVAGLSLSADVSAGLPTPEADGRRLLRALENLLRNAVDHARSEVVAAVLPVAGGLRFEVRDDGPGLPEEDGRIDFAQLGARRSRDDSAGLGLTVTRRVAEAHGGTVGAANRPTGGARVWLDIPFAGDGSAVRSAPSA